MNQANAEPSSGRQYRRIARWYGMIVFLDEFFLSAEDMAMRYLNQKIEIGG
tara:strand:+ start:9620 stop:9772 length:153 start_codon:yes stop_codon:yes gene_type:complete